jgi:hypothetical protein
MPSRLPTRFTSRSSDEGHSRLEKVLTEIVEREGAALFLRLLQEKAQSGPAAARPSLASATRVQIGKLIRGARRINLREAPQQGLALTLKSAQELPTRLQQSVRGARRLVDVVRQGGIEGAVMGALSSAGYVGGVLLGLQLPDVDYRLKRQGSPKDEITVHSAPIFSMSVALEWLQAIVARAQMTPRLHPNDRKQIEALQTVLRSLTRGVAQGASLPRLTATAPAVHISLEESAFRAADQMFSTLSDKK